MATRVGWRSASARVAPNAYTNLEPRQAVTARALRDFCQYGGHLEWHTVIRSGDGHYPVNQLPASVVDEWRKQASISPARSAVTAPDSTGLPVTAPAYTSSRLALLKWWGVSSADNTVTVGAGPWACVFDGANIWVANFGNGTVSKVNASTGATIATYGAQ